MLIYIFYDVYFCYKPQSSIIDIYMDDFMISSDGKILATASGQLKTFGCSDKKKLQKFSGHPVCYIYTCNTLPSFTSCPLSYSPSSIHYHLNILS